MTPPAEDFHQHRRRAEAAQHRADVNIKVLPGRRMAFVAGTIAVAACAFVVAFAQIGASATRGCVRDQNTTAILRGILQRSLQANEQLHESGVRNEEEYKIAKTLTKESLDRLVIPSC